MKAFGVIVVLTLGCASPAGEKAPGGESSWDRLAAQARALRPPTPAGDTAILDGLEGRARDTLASIRRAEDRASWEKAVPKIRAELRRSLGLDLLPRALPKNVRSVGVVAREEYRIEKLVYETLPS